MCCAQAGGDGGGGGGDPLVAGNGGRQEEVVEQCLPGGRDTWEPSVAKQKLPSLSSLDESKMDKGSLPEPRV